MGPTWPTPTTRSAGWSRQSKTSANSVLYVDGKAVARNSMENSTPITFPEDETFDIGQDTRTGVALLEYRYDVPFKFTGTINKLTFNLAPEQVTAGEREQMKKTVAPARD